ncbi:unnamed protein product [Dibothriocephalus latus]|uniref:G-protein coupled receptors family 1 profile domain-containing protein n=1 Tax=Dibothriocephalus latus TaxID=60516 RepID=A0A3P6TWY4_DIBLA|nr:unnamed protein product [Dibothriocephalus latus]
MLPPECRNLYESGLARILVTHISLGIALLGIPANIFALIVLHAEKACRSPTHILLIALAIEDIMIILFYGMYYIAMHYYESYNMVWLGFLRYIDTPLFYLVNWIKMIEIYTVVLLSLERYTAIRWPLKAAHLCSVGRTKRGLLIITLFSGIFKLPNLILDYRVLQWSPACKDYKLVAIFREKSWYDTFKLVHVQLLDQVCSFVIPLSLLVFLNFGLIMRIRRFERRHKSGQWSIKPLNGSIAIITRKTSYKPQKPNSCVSELEDDDTDLTLPPRGTCYSFNSRLRVPRKPILTERIFAEPSVTSSNASPEQTLNGNQQGALRNTMSIKGGHNANASRTSRSILLTLIGVVTTFIICETPTTVCFLFEIWHLVSGIVSEGGKASLNTSLPDNSPANSTNDQSANPYDLYYYAYPAALVLVLVGCASNFFIYVLMGRRFRRTCIRLLVRCSCVICSHFRRRKSKRNEEDSGFIRPLKHRHTLRPKKV